MHKEHFFLGNNIAEARNFTPQNQGYGKKPLPERDRAEHAQFIREHYEEVVNQAIASLDERERNGLPAANGVYVDLEMDKKFIPSSLGGPDGRTGACIVKVTDKDENNVGVTVYVKRDKKDWLSSKADLYAHKDTKKGKPQNEKLIEPIDNIKQADIQSLYVSPEQFDAIPEGGIYRYELWISHNKDNVADAIRDVLNRLNINVITSPLVFDSVDVWLIDASKQQLRSLPLSLGNIEGVRPYHEPSVLLSSNSESREWAELIKSITDINQDVSSTQIGILDSGVNNEHPLLSSVLPNERMDVAIGVTDTFDYLDHGTGMAGLATYGDLTDIIYQRGDNVPIRHCLASVKIIDNGHVTSQEFYGAVIEEAIDKASNMGATIQCMAVTDDDAYDGTSTSSSAALDESIYNDGNCDRLVVVSAGNVNLVDVDQNNYIESCKANGILSPSQAWNALTVGAFTEKVECPNEEYKPLAAPGGLSPYSRSSFPWSQKRNKPEIVMEGGNVGYHSVLKSSLCPNLSLITTSPNLTESLESFTATSAATALAARLAAKIKEENKRLSMLSVRGLIVHSSQWTDEMQRIVDMEERMSLCGYGVPNEDIAIYSSEKYATYIFENTIVPYEEGENGKNKYHQLHYYDLPWPKDLLSEMGDEEVKIRITLSYYVKPSPGYAGRTSKYRYPSATLHFDLKTATETPEEFLSRRNQIDGEKTTENDASRWTIKQQKRERGTVQSDWIECTAIELSELEKIVVYPGQGWWKERKLDNVKNEVPYSLIVSIETKETDIYNAVEVAINNRIGVQVAQEI